MAVCALQKGFAYLLLGRSEESFDSCLQRCKTKVSQVSRTLSNMTEQGK